MSGSDISLSRASRLRFALVGTAVLAAAAALAVAGATPSEPPAHEYTAVFDRAGQGLDAKSRVKVRGMTVGSVASVTLDERGRAVVRLRVDKGVRVPATVSAEIEPLSVFGPKDVALDLGAGEGQGPYLPDGSTITKTVNPAELSETGRPLADLAEAIDPDDVATVLHTLAAALRGNGAKLHKTTDDAAKILNTAHADLDRTTRTLKDLAVLSDVLGGRSDKIAAIIEDADALSDTLAAHPDDFEATLANARTLAGTLSRTLERDGDALGELVDRASLVNNTLYPRQKELRELIGGLNEFFGGLAAILQLPGPEGTKMGAVNLFVSLNLCDTFNEACPATWMYGGSPSAGKERP
ncbi:MlaD family protein [Actinocorallia sp. A-T 12471]|uniref:MlaD family protein n=1 Tax=Actinocorallia sp. A-T 12471 TaxID=3089813 RepID=UPI0029CE99CD|nr:MlaD family protein [Actinocorallia sp. A-T 12471]MDX6743605.1 MlaD family protein [Actinocorallia sp. A-T 12471]